MKKFDDLYNELKQLEVKLEVERTPEEKELIESKIKELGYKLAALEAAWLYEDLD